MKSLHIMSAAEPSGGNSSQSVKGETLLLHSAVCILKIIFHNTSVIRWSVIDGHNMRNGITVLHHALFCVSDTVTFINMELFTTAVRLYTRDIFW